MNADIFELIPSLSLSLQQAIVAVAMLVRRFDFQMAPGAPPVSPPSPVVLIKFDAEVA